MDLIPKQTFFRRSSNSIFGLDKIPKFKYYVNLVTYTLAPETFFKKVFLGRLDELVLCRKFEFRPGLNQQIHNESGPLKAAHNINVIESNGSDFGPHCLLKSQRLSTTARGDFDIEGFNRLGRHILVV